MKALDRLLQRWRINKARPYIKQNARVLDIGCADGALLQQLNSLIRDSVGIDPDLPYSTDRDGHKLIAGRFPDDLPDARPFDAITMLAVWEHVPPALQSSMARHCAQFLKPGGNLIVTVPSPKVDHILRFLRALHLIDGMSLEQHYGFDPKILPQLLSGAGLTLFKSEKFQLGLNHLLVFKK
ncbi:methyltransferase domain-containing protein [bacterium]|nr:methyltransferase domain-containing protein [bacterium]